MKKKPGKERTKVDYVFLKERDQIEISWRGVIRMVCVSTIFCFIWAEKSYNWLYWMKDVQKIGKSGKL